MSHLYFLGRSTPFYTKHIWTRFVTTRSGNSWFVVKERFTIFREQQDNNPLTTESDNNMQAVADVRLKIDVALSSVCIAPTHYDLIGIDLLIALDTLVLRQGDVLVKNELVLGNLTSSTDMHVPIVNGCSPPIRLEQFLVVRWIS